MMKRVFSSHVTLVELTSALFFLMLAMATIMGLFTKAYGMSSEAERLTQAVQLAQSCAALIEGSDNPAAILQDHGYELDKDQVLIHKADDGMMVSVKLNTEQTRVGMLDQGTISVAAGGEMLISWPVARYIIRK